MGRYLIVANQTLGGEKLEEAVRDRIRDGHGQFYVVVPMTAFEHEAQVWSGGFPGPEDLVSGNVQAVLEEKARLREALLDEARRRAEDRLRQMVDKIQSLGGEAEGRVGDPDPVVAAGEVLSDESFDEIIISTLPVGISRWLKMDLPSRVGRMTEVPVTTVEAEG